MKKGASTAIITVLVMLITVSLILMSYQWLLKSAPETQQELENSLPQKEGCLKIENIDTLNKKITVRNCGGSDLDNFIIYIDDKPVGNYLNKLSAGGIIQISYTGYVTPGVNHNIKVSSNYADSPTITFLKKCDIYITQIMIPYTIDQSYDYYCLNESVSINGDNAINFSTAGQGSVLDCQGYTIDGNDTDNVNGVYIQAANAMVRNCILNDWYVAVNSTNAVGGETITDNTVTSGIWGAFFVKGNNNIITGNVANNNRYYGIYLSSSNYSTIERNVFNGYYDSGISMYSSSGNKIHDNTLNNNNWGITIQDWGAGTYNNEIMGGSIVLNNVDYHFAGNEFGRMGNNYFINTNFTGTRNISLENRAFWFNYKNDSSSSIWLNTSSFNPSTITRKLITWSQQTLDWNDTATAQTVATYNISGLSINYLYNIYNNSILAYSLTSSSSGQINFTIYLPANQEHEIKIVRTSYIISPLWFSNSTNNTVAGKPTLFSLNWTDDVGLSGYIFSTNNTGTWVNDTWISFPGIAFDSLGSANATGSGNSYLSWNHKIGSSGNRMLIVITGLEDGSNKSVSSVTYNGVNLAFLGQSSKFTPSNWARTEIWYLNESGLPLAGTYEIQANWSSGVGLAMAASISVSGIAQAPPENMTINSTESQTTIITEIRTLTDKAWVIEAVTSGLGPGTFTQGIGQTEFADMTVGTGATTAGSYKIVTTAGVTTMNETQSGIANRMSHILTAWAPALLQQAWSNVTKTLNSTVGSNVQWCVYANDTSNNWNYTSCFNPFSFTTTTAYCDYSISTCSNLNQANKVYCLASNISSNYTCLNISAQNVTLDCQGFTINHCKNVTSYTGIEYYGINATSGYGYINIKNCRIAQENSVAVNCPAIRTYGMYNSTVQNNTIIGLAGGDFGIYLSNSSNNLILSNNITTAGYGSSGIALNYPSHYNTIVNNIIFTTGTDASGIEMGANIYNNITGGSIIAQNANDYYVSWSGPTNTFTNTNFTGQRDFEISARVDEGGWFAYSNDSSSNIWLKTAFSTNYVSANRTLISWNQNIMKWNDTSDTIITATYNITGLVPNSYYNVYNNSVVISGSPFSSSSSGQINFTIYLPTGQERMITVNSTVVGSIMRLNFNEANGTKVYDSSVYGNDGTFYGETFNDGTLGNGTVGTQPTILFGSSCKYGSCLGFEGIPNESAEVVNTSDFMPNSSLTIMAWIYPKEIYGDERAIVSKWGSGGGTDEWLFRLQNATKARLEFHINNITGGYEGPVSSSGANDDMKINTNIWTHVAVVYDRDNKNVSFYKNGTYIGGGQFSLNGQTRNGTEIIRIGAQGGITFDPFNGTIDEVRMWNRTLSQAEINAEMQSSLPVVRPIASWSFEESGNYVNDTHIWVNGTYGSALSFDGVNDYVNVTDSNSLDVINFTAAFWIKWKDTTNSWNRILNKKLNWNDNNGWDINLVGPGYMTGGIEIEGSGGAMAWIKCVDDWRTTDLNVWHHVAVIFNGSTAYLYCDGNYKGSGAIDSIVANNRPLFIGRIESENNWFNGTIDEVRIWNRTLSQAEIQAEMSNP